MLDIVGNGTSGTFGLPFQQGGSGPTASPELALLSRQAHALEYIATQLGFLSSRAGQAIELQQDYELATRRLLQEPV